MVLHVMKTTRSQKIWNETKMKKRAKDVKRVRASKKESSKQGMAISRSIDVFQGRCEKAKDRVGYDLYMYTSNWFYTEKNQGLVVNLYMYTSNWFPRLISSSAALQVTYDTPEIGWHWGPRSGDAVGHLDVHEPWTDQHQSGCM
jgi:hypothetical protein